MSESWERPIFESIGWSEEVDVITDSDAMGPGTKTFWCPGCGCGHYFTPDRWTWDGNRAAPTVTPSILVGYDGADGSRRCHFFLRAGRIEYCGDSTHALAGQSVAMDPSWGGTP